MSKTKEPTARKFVATYEDLDGNIVKEKLTAVDGSSARMLLASQGKVVIEIDPVKSWTEIEFGKSVNDAALLQFTRQMAAFTAAGISIASALELLESTTKNKTLKAAIGAMLGDIKDGVSLAGAVQQHAKLFPAYYPALLAASERSGDMSGAFETLAGYIERDLTSKRAVRSALYYPSVLIVLGIGAVFLLTTVVLPRFESFFSSLNAQLPVATRVLMAFSRFMTGHLLQILLLIVVAAIAFLFALQNPKGRRVIDAVLLKLPVVGPLVELVVLERYARVLGTLSAAGVPLPDALTLASRVVGNQIFSTAIVQTRRGVMNGEGLSGPMLATKVFPDAMIQVIGVGEQTGRLSQQLEQSSTMYGKELDYKLKNLTSLLEPVILLIVGGGVGFVAIALVSAMYGIYNSGQLSG